MVGGVLLGSSKVLSSRFPRFCLWWDVKPQGGGGGGGGGGGNFFHLSRVRFHLLKLTPSFVFFFSLFACRMTRGYEEVSRSQDERWRVTP